MSSDGMSQDEMRRLFAERQRTVDELNAGAEAFRSAHPEIVRTSDVKRGKS